MHDYHSKTGQGYGGEYRYNFGQGTDGNFSAHLDNTHAYTYVLDDGTQSSIPDQQTYEFRGNASQMLPGHLQARGNVSYFSSITASQAFNTNIYDQTRNNRTYGGNIVGAWSAYSLNATANHSEYFYDPENSSLSGS